MEGADLLDDVGADLCFGSGYLDDSAHVAEEDEGYSSEDPYIVNPAGQDDVLVQVLFQLGGEHCTLEIGNAAGWAVRQGCSAWNRTGCLFF